MKTITLNSVKFALDKTEVVDSLFTTGGTVSGYLKVLKNSVKIFNLQDKLIGVVNKEGVLCKATLQECGKHWFSYGDIDLIGPFTGYGDYRRQVDEVKYLQTRFN